MKLFTIFAFVNKFSGKETFWQVFTPSVKHYNDALEEIKKLSKGNISARTV